MFVFRFQEILGIHLPFLGVRGGRSGNFPTFEALSLFLSLLCLCVAGVDLNQLYCFHMSYL